MKYLVFNATDGVMAHSLAMTEIEAEEYIPCFRDRFRLQGYYKTADGRRIAPDQVELVLQPVPETFAEFQATRTHIEAAAMDKLGYTVGPETVSGLCYLGALVIEDASQWGEKLRQGVQNQHWYLMLDNQEFWTDDIEVLEEKLYEYAKSEGFCG